MIKRSRPSQKRMMKKMKLNETLDDEKPKMENCPVFYVNIGCAHPSETDTIIEQAIKNIKESGLDSSNVLFVPTRTLETGWQFPI